MLTVVYSEEQMLEPQSLEEEFALALFDQRLQQVDDVVLLREMCVKLHALNLGRQRVYESLLRGLE